MRSIRLRQGILCSKKSFGSTKIIKMTISLICWLFKKFQYRYHIRYVFKIPSVTFALRILFKCIGYRNRPIAQILPVHWINGNVGCFKACIVDKGKSFRITSLRITLNLWLWIIEIIILLAWGFSIWMKRILDSITSYLWCSEDDTEGRKCVVK